MKATYIVPVRSSSTLIPDSSCNDFAKSRYMSRLAHATRKKSFSASASTCGARIPPAAHEASRANSFFSTTVTSRTPRIAKARAMVRPMTPPPITTTSADDGELNDSTDIEYSLGLCAWCWCSLKKWHGASRREDTRKMRVPHQNCTGTPGA